MGESKSRKLTLRFGRGRERRNIAFISPKAGELREYDPKARAMGRDRVNGRVSAIKMIHTDFAQLYIVQAVQRLTTFSIDDALEGHLAC